MKSKGLIKIGSVRWFSIKQEATRKVSIKTNQT